MSTSKHTVYRDLGTDYKGIKACEETIPEISKHEILIKIKAVSLNYRDILIANGTYPIPFKKEVVPCADGAGEVVQVGCQVQNIKVGDHVVAIANITNQYGMITDLNNGLGASLDGMLQQYKVIPADGVIKLPENTHISFAEAASLPTAGVTAWNCLYGGIPFIAGQSVLFLGTGGVSIIGLILAKAAGAKTIITSSSDEKLKYVQEKYGADYTINYKTHINWEEEVLRLTDGEGVDFVIENGGAGTIAKSIASTKRGGQVLLVGFLAQTEAKANPDLAMLILERAINVRGIAVGSKQLFEQMIQFIHNKKLHMPVDKEFGFSNDQVLAAFDYLKSANHIGKIGIRVD